AVIDTLCLAVISSLVEQSKEAQDTVMEWRKHENIYIKRASIVSFIKHAKRKELTDTLLRHASTFFGINHDLITKANGWLLREIGKSNPQKLEGFLTKNIKKIPRTTLRYAIEKFPETKRKWILKIPYK
ncbi:MAG: DNA alkylation repair protein, partial [Candidatus Marinimicrobia bacterium]|nr:DNA alkylation repair protein [Candidatus Neomarinimicrobiota bacterium]